ncbi:GumC family protein [Flavobacterium psychrotolerans]|uniref:non-specific protein-tyrosine kinase n=1 Tax=Flavobacterium psychrotolerans TaxID=2169410 RepID=A0A2U1JI74_9FLAO|nr:polysaccharide biosynthesis tyrosine autokinase [Flavobacterium psychrotolerans]PWA04880.1 tyrosine protein kinase [Flavobacterium psychrotolerans]
MGRKNSDKNQEQDQEVHIGDVLAQYVTHWKWFVLGITIALIIAFLYLRYATPQYQATTTILVKDEKKGGMMSELSAFADLGLGGGMKNNVDNEVEILKSRTLVESTVKKLNLNINLFAKGNVNDIEVYEESPIEVNFINKFNRFYESKMVLEFLQITPETFELENAIFIGSSKTILNDKKEFRFGELIKTKYGDLIITKKNRLEEPVSNTYEKIAIKVSPLEQTVESFQSRLNVTSLSKTSSIVTLTITDPVVKKSEEFLDNLIQIYNQNAVTDKNIISEKTSEFIDNRLKLITQELGGVEQDVESFKRTNNLTDIESETKLFIEGANAYNNKVLETEIQLNMVSSMLGFMKNSTNSDLLPANLIAGQNDASSLINSYNQLVLDRNRILKTATLANPTVVKMDQQMASLKSNVLASLNRLQSNLIIQKRDLKGKEGNFNSKIGKIPVQERQFRIIARQQKVKEELYLYLLQKREETAISLSATEPNARVIDLAKALKIPVAPKKNVIYLVALLLGLLIPFGIIYAIGLLDTKVKSSMDLIGKTNIPFIGDVPTSASPFEIMNPGSRTSTAEALRIIRSNLEFMGNKDHDGKAKTFFVTSTVPSEGKTFISANLAATFALSGSSVLLIEMDVRNPKLSKYFKLPTRGVTNYLSSNELNLDNFRVKQEGYDNFYVIPAGIVPPNPAELLMSKKVDSLFKSIKSQYDYIIVDTAPVSLVADTTLIAKNADCFVYVFRANYLGKRMLDIANTFYKGKKLPNMCLLLNDTDSRKGYGYGYGYGVKHEITLPWYKKIMKI